MKHYALIALAGFLLMVGCRDSSSPQAKGDPDPLVSQRIHSTECGAIAVQLHGEDGWTVYNVPDGSNQEMADCAYSVLIGQGLADETRVVIQTLQQRIKETTWGCIKAGMANC